MWGTWRRDKRGRWKRNNVKAISYEFFFFCFCRSSIFIPFGGKTIEICFFFIIKMSVNFRIRLHLFRHCLLAKNVLFLLFVAQTFLTFENWIERLEFTARTQTHTNDKARKSEIPYYVKLVLPYSFTTVCLRDRVEWSFSTTCCLNETMQKEETEGRMMHTMINFRRQRRCEK